MSREGGRHGHDRGHGGSSWSGPSNKPTGNQSKRCEMLGHWARECHSKPKREHAHIAQDEEEASLLDMKSSSTISSTSSIDVVPQGVEKR
jgi:hypothetical protein